MNSVASGQADFSDLLRSWRKARKQSQWSLALDAGVSQRHLSFLESGRSAPSREMVLLLSGCLDLPLREQNILLNAAGFASIFTELGIDRADLEPAKQALTMMLQHHEPYPAVVVDRNWNLVLSNQAMLKLMGVFVDLETVWQDTGTDQTPNIMKLSIHPRGLWPWIANQAQIGWYFQRQISRELSDNPRNVVCRDLLEALDKMMPGLSPANIPPKPDSPYLELRLVKDELKLNFFTMISTFGTPQDVTLQELRTESFFPADNFTARFMEKLASSA
ncbi:MAG: helix-turn-helix domain-containing protein [Pseudomonadales bacterium]|nr:helix-turn-helix domain-containing protein [Pseudomonadales bacterium]